MSKKSVRSTPYAAPDARQPVLAELRRQKMARSPHAYERGTAAHFYEWLESRPVGTLPEGPSIWICGDCHLGNLGPVADAAGDVAVHVRDVDQSVIGNPVHDLVRLGLILATAARSSGLPGLITSLMAGALLDGYEQAFDDSRSDETSRTQRPDVVRIAMKEALHRSCDQLARQNIDHIRLTFRSASASGRCQGSKRTRLTHCSSPARPCRFTRFWATGRAANRPYVSSMPLLGKGVQLAGPAPICGITGHRREVFRWRPALPHRYQGSCRIRGAETCRTSSYAA